jgi:hypothetical protein
MFLGHLYKLTSETRYLYRPDDLGKTGYFKEQFPHEHALEKFLVSRFESYNQRFATRCHNGFDQARADLLAMFST